MWRAIGCSVIGTSHEKSQLPCQDFSDYYFCVIGGEKVLLIGIADGAGSASASDVGSQQAVQHLLTVISGFGRNLREISEQVVVDWIGNVRAHLEQVALERSLPLREIACTLLFAILGESYSIFIQIGDGAWVANVNGKYMPMTWPTGGEYANQTTFVTSPNWREALQFIKSDIPIYFVSGFTDGLQTVALHLSSRSVHAPFFDAKFSVLKNTYDETELRAPLIEYLSSVALLEHTDDDKTLVLASREEMKLLGHSLDLEGKTNSADILPLEDEPLESATS